MICGTSRTSACQCRAGAPSAEPGGGRASGAAQRRRLDPATGEFLPTWDDALDAIGDEEEPLHVARLGPRFDAQGVLAGPRDSARYIGYLTKYLTKQVAGCHQAQTDALAALEKARSRSVC